MDKKKWFYNIFFKNENNEQIKQKFILKNYFQRNKLIILYTKLKDIIGF
jgi:hypothetical protein